ncbi:YitT family protein [Mesotoga prima]|uniref:YitT family protein n=1 Tax=Mesotoga prima TaxID=1184387 RepID=UPI002FE1371B
MTRKTFMDYSLITVGSILTAMSIVSFMVPNNIIAGGVSGLAIIVYRVFGLWVGAQMFVYNIVLFLLAFVTLGVGFGMKSIYSAVLMSLSVDLLQKLSFPVFDASSTQDGFLLVAIYGGVIAGAGMGLVLWRGASTGGTDIVAMILSKYVGFSTGTGLLISDSLITLLAVVVFGPIAAMYGIITIFTTSKTIDGIIEGIGNTRTAFVISKESEAIKEKVINEMERGTTIIKATGGFSGEDRPVLMVSIRRREIGQLRHIVKTTDRRAFVVVVNNSEVFGEGFKDLS